MEDSSRILARRAIEALRSGVPNRDAVRELGVFQADVTRKFAALREELGDGSPSRRHLFISAGFGCGKSHLLEYLRHDALEHNCVCSYVVISKETPLYDLLKLLRAAAETAVIPGKAGRAIPEILFSHKFSSAEFARLYESAHRDDAFGQRIAAQLRILEEASKGMEEIIDMIAWEWSGYPMQVRDIRSCLKELGLHKEYRVDKILQGVLAVQLWRFLPRLFRAAGYHGWVVLFDEVELMLRYGKLQRARSYANVARLAGEIHGFETMGLLPVFATTDDFWTVASQEKKDTEVPEWLQVRGKRDDAELARDANVGMRLLKHPTLLRRAQDEELEALKHKIRDLHSTAFQWEAPLPAARETLASSSVRENVKSWITQLDLMLLYPDYRPIVTAERVEQDYSEDEDLSGDEQNSKTDSSNDL